LGLARRRRTLTRYCNTDGIAVLQPASQFHNSYYCYSLSPVLRFPIPTIPGSNSCCSCCSCVQAGRIARVLRGARARGYRSIELGACLAVLLIRGFEAEGRRGAGSSAGGFDSLFSGSLDSGSLGVLPTHHLFTYLPTYLFAFIHSPSTRLELVGWWTRLESSIHAHAHAHAHAPHVPN